MTSPDSKNVDKAFNSTTLVEDGFGTYWDQSGKSHEIKRFTWKNRNKIQVQVINYGARIVSMKLPDRKGVIEDIVLGFDDLAGYIFYQPYYFGATIGRTSQIVENGSFKLNDQEYQLTKNHEKHHLNGGLVGLDQIVWDTHIIDKKVIMSCMSKQFSEGYPGNVLIRITFELSDMNEFKIDYEAFTTHPTLINLSNLLYVNLAGQHRGAEDIYKHIVTINADCFLKQKNSVPTGDVCNVANFPFDFQVPKVLGKLMGISPGDGFKEYLCINKGANQDNCFVGRLVHNSSGRVLEVYSNQRCVCFSTANDFGCGRVRSMQELIKTSQLSSNSSQNIKTAEQSQSQLEVQDETANDYEFIEFLVKLHGLLAESLQEDKENNYDDLRDLIVKLGGKRRTVLPETPYNSPADSLSIPQTSAVLELVLTDRQREYVKGLYNAALDVDSEFCERLINAIRKLLRFSLTLSMMNSISNNPKSEDSKKFQDTINARSDNKITSKSKGTEKKNKIPTFYKDQPYIVGKNRTIYRTHSGIALQTMNFPGAEKYKKFPSSFLNPGETYKHTIIYRFWVRAGNPSKWVKKNKTEKEKLM